MSTLVNSTREQSRRIGPHLQEASRLIAPGICALYLVLGGAFLPLGPRSASARPLISFAALSSRSVPVVGRSVALGGGIVINGDINGGPPTI